jgi:photosystem II stability/assembly factor-like uncharacterized protein
VRRFSSILLGVFCSFLIAACVGNPSAALRTARVRGLAVDAGDSSRLYLAAQSGLFVLRNDADLQRVGSDRTGYLSFSPHPTDRNVFFRSGLLEGGQSTGVQRSDDGGETWSRISDGNGESPAILRALLAHPANPRHLYGWNGIAVNRSLDGGETWDTLSGPPGEVHSLAGDPLEERVLYAGTAGGLLVSRNGGSSWNSMANAISNDVVFDVEVDPGGNSLLLATRDRGILRVSAGEGAVVEVVGKLPRGNVPERLARDPRDAQTMYAYARSLSLYKSGDGGRTWQKVF